MRQRVYRGCLKCLPYGGLTISWGLGGHCNIIVSSYHYYGSLRNGHRIDKALPRMYSLLISEVIVNMGHYFHIRIVAGSARA